MVWILFLPAHSNFPFSGGNGGDAGGGERGKKNGGRGWGGWLPLVVIVMSLHFLLT